MSTQQFTENSLITQDSVVVGVDGSASSELALRWAAHEAQRRHQRLHVVHALETELLVSNKQPLGTKEEPASKDPILAAALDAIRTMAPQVEATPHSVSGFAPSTLIAASLIAGTVVVGSQGRSGLPHALLGSVSQQVAVQSSCPVVVVRGKGMHDGIEKGPVVVGVDGSEASSPALGYAFAYAASTGCALVAVHTWWWEPLEGIGHGEPGEPWMGDWTEIALQEETLTSQSLAGWLEKYPDVPVRSHVVRGDPVIELLDQSRDGRLLVVGSRGRGGFMGLLLGSVSRRVLKRATVPVAVVRSVAEERRHMS